MDKKKTEYTVVKADSIATLTSLVEMLLSQDWQLQGGIAVRTKNDGRVRLYQAMTREEGFKDAKKEGDE